MSKSAMSATPVKVGEAGSSLTGTPTDASVTYNGKSCKG